MTSHHGNGRDEGNFVDIFARRLASATSRRDAIHVTLAALFGSTIATACTGLTSADSCAAGCKGSDGKCYSCSSGSFCSSGGGSGCSSPVGGIYCCSGSSGGTTGGSTCPCSRGYTYNFSSRLCCVSSTPYYYPGTHGITAPGCYASCPYVGDCGTTYQAC